jgi:hypothetical protein
VVGEPGHGEQYAEHERADGRQAERLQGGEHGVGDVLPDARVVEDVPHLGGEVPLLAQPEDRDGEQPQDGQGAEDGVDAVADDGLGAGGVEENAGTHRATSMRRSRRRKIPLIVKVMTR